MNQTLNTMNTIHCQSLMLPVQLGLHVSRREKATDILSLSSKALTHDNACGASDDTDDNVSEAPRKKTKVDSAAVIFWASWDMHHEHNEELQSETSSQPSHVETELDKFLAKLCFLRKSNPPL